MRKDKSSQSSIEPFLSTYKNNVSSFKNESIVSLTAN